MGCGASSLKGEDINVNAAPKPTEPAPPKRIRTDFNSIDYERDASNTGRRMTEFAPHETGKGSVSHHHESGVHGSSSQPPITSSRGASLHPDDPSASLSHQDNGGLITDPNAQAAEVLMFPHERSTTETASKLQGDDPLQLKPYQTIGDDSWDNDDTTTAANSNTEPGHRHGDSQYLGVDPTTSEAKTQFASENDPASLENQEAHHAHHHHDKSKHSKSSNPDKRTQSEERKKSWFGDKYSKYQAVKSGRNITISDEDLKKYTGKTRQELNQWADGRPGVGGNQDAGRIANDNARGGAQAWAPGC